MMVRSNPANKSTVEEFEQFVDWFTLQNDGDTYEVHSRIMRLGREGPRKFVYLFHDLLELYSPGPKDRKVLEKAAKHMVRKRIRVSRDAYRNEVTLLKTFLATAKSVSRGKRKAASEHVTAGSFKLINMGGFPDKTMKLVASLVKEAEDKLRKLGMESVIYGEIKVVNTIMGTALAHYWPITDEVYVRANIRKGVGVESIIHELAHRFHYKNPDSKTVIEALYRAVKRRQEDVLDKAITDKSNWPKAGELIGKPPAFGELESRWQVVGLSYGRGLRVELKRLDSDQRGQVSMRGYLEMEGKVPKIFVSRYAMVSATENFAEMVSMYSVGKVNEEQRQVFEQVLGRLGVVPKANPTGNWPDQSSIKIMFCDDESPQWQTDRAWKIAKASEISILSHMDLKAIALVKGHVAGALFDSLEQDKYSFDIVVDPDHRGQGVGSALLDAGLDEFAALDGFVLDLKVVNPHMRAALSRRGIEVPKANPTHNRNCPNCGERIDLKSRYVALFDDELFCNVECAKGYRYANEEEGPIFNLRGANENPTKAPKKEFRRLGAMVIDSISDDLRLPRYRGNKNKLAGHCYVASEALWHLLGGKSSDWTPMFVQHEGEPHWFLVHGDGTVADLTSSQFSTPVPYDRAMHRAFLSKKPNIGGPSKRARVVLERISRTKRGVNENPTKTGATITFETQRAYAEFSKRWEEHGPTSDLDYPQSYMFSSWDIDYAYMLADEICGVRIDDHNPKR